MLTEFNPEVNVSALGRTVSEDLPEGERQTYRNFNPRALEAQVGQISVSSRITQDYVERPCLNKTHQEQISYPREKEPTRVER